MNSPNSQNDAVIYFSAEKLVTQELLICRGYALFGPKLPALPLCFSMGALIGKYAEILELPLTIARRMEIGWNLEPLLREPAHAVISLLLKKQLKTAYKILTQSVRSTLLYGLGIPVSALNTFDNIPPSQNLLDILSEAGNKNWYNKLINLQMKGPLPSSSIRRAEKVNPGSLPTIDRYTKKTHFSVSQGKKRTWYLR